MAAKEHIRLFSLFSIIFLIVQFNLSGQEKQSYSGIREAVFSSAKLRGDPGPREFQWIDDGESYSYTSINNTAKHREIRRFSPAAQTDTLVVDVDELTLPSGEKFDYSSYSWTRDSKHILFETNFRPIYRNSGISDYYLYSLQDHSLNLLVKDARSALVSPDGSMTAYERDGNMFVNNISGEAEKQLTDDAGEDLYYGHFDWDYEEEFGIGRAWNWSPDSRYIAFWQVDESNEPVYQMTDYEGQHPDYVKFRVPLVGDTNAKVKIGIADVVRGTKTWLKVDDEYIPRIYWTNDAGMLAVVTLNRKQNDVKLFFFDVSDGSRKLIFEEKSDTWIDIHNFYENVLDMFYFPSRLDEFFWLSDRDGYQHIYRYDYEGRLLNQVTKGDWMVTRIEGINVESKTIYYTSTEISPLERQLYSINFDGTGKQRISREAGKHSFNLSPDTRYYLDIYSNVNLPKQVELHSADGKMITKLQDNKSVDEFIQRHQYSPTRLFRFRTSDGTNLDGEIIRPFDFDSTKKYPVIFDVYGGPNSQDVFNAFAADGWRQWLAQQGYIIVDINNRGNANYGCRFMKIVYEHLGKWESNDYTETLNYLSAFPYVDTSNAAIMGTSYGGYITIYTMLAHPGVFKVGMANSAVTDWLLYDDIYTERYMGLKDENREGYEESSCVFKAGSLDGKLLIIHSTMDDNVHVQNTMQMLTALTNAGKDADLRIYPSGGHGAVYSRESYMLMLELYNNYLYKYLK